VSTTQKASIRAPATGHDSDTTLRPLRLFFTEPGFSALRVMMADRRLANPTDFAHVRQELDIDPPRR
jgi:hypothetical protein